VLSAEEGVNLGGVAVVLVPLLEEVLHPDNAVSLGEVVTELGIACPHATLVERPGQL
jgi:hypothetical protein